MALGKVPDTPVPRLYARRKQGRRPARYAAIIAWTSGASQNEKS